LLWYFDDESHRHLQNGYMKCGMVSIDIFEWNGVWHIPRCDLEWGNEFPRRLPFNIVTNQRWLETRLNLSADLYKLPSKNRPFYNWPICFCYYSKWCANFTNIFTLSFYARRSRKRKNTDNLTVFFTHLGSSRVKAARRKFMKSTPGLMCSFSGESVYAS